MRQRVYRGPHDIVVERLVKIAACMRPTCVGRDRLHLVKPIAIPRTRLSVTRQHSRPGSSPDQPYPGHDDTP